MQEENADPKFLNLRDICAKSELFPADKYNSEITLKRRRSYY
jgi:hypothetical protein